MRKYNIDYRVATISGNIYRIAMLRKGQYSWTHRNIDITDMANEPKYIQQFILQQKEWNR